MNISRKDFAIFIVLLVITWLSLGSVQAKPVIKLKVDWSQKRWENYPQSLNKPVSEWASNTLYVHVVVNWSADRAVDDSNPSMSITDSVLTLCYQHKSEEKLSPQGLPNPGSIVPVILNFSINDIPKKQYTIKVSDNCL